MRKYKVTFKMWRETWNGNDQCDGERSVVMEASSKKAAINKAVKQRLNPGKGMAWSHSIWTTDETAEPV